VVKWCFPFGVVIFAIGVIEAIYILVDGSFFFFLVSLVASFINAAVYFAVAELDEKIRRIEEFNVKTAGLQGIHIKDTDMQSYVYNTMSDRKLLEKGGWKCQSCGRINASYVGTCACGKVKE